MISIAELRAVQFIMWIIFFLSCKGNAKCDAIHFCITFKGTFNLSLASKDEVQQALVDQVVGNSDTRIKCSISNFDLTFEGNSSNAVVTGCLSCQHRLSSSALSDASQSLNTAVTSGLKLTLPGVNMSSTAPLLVDGKPYTSGISDEELIIIGVTVSASALFFIVSMVGIYKIQECQARRVLPDDSSTQKLESRSENNDSLVNESESAERNVNPKDVLTRYQPAASKTITAWQPLDYYSVKPRPIRLFELRQTRRVYALTDETSFTKLCIVSVDVNGSFRKLRSELQDEVEKVTGSVQFIFLNEELKSLPPHSECSYLIGTVYNYPSILIRLLRSHELVTYGWMFCACGNIGKRECSCSPQLYCSRFCQKHGIHSELCSVHRPQSIEPQVPGHLGAEMSRHIEPRVVSRVEVYTLQLDNTGCRTEDQSAARSNSTAGQHKLSSIFSTMAVYQSQQNELYTNQRQNNSRDTSNRYESDTEQSDNISLVPSISELDHELTEDLWKVNGAHPIMFV